MNLVGQDSPLTDNLKSTAHFIFEQMDLHDVGLWPWSFVSVRRI